MTHSAWKVPHSKPKVEQVDIDAVSECLRSQFHSGGEAVSSFESALASYHGVDHAQIRRAEPGIAVEEQQLFTRSIGERYVQTTSYFSEVDVANRLGLFIRVTDKGGETTLLGTSIGPFTTRASRGEHGKQEQR